MNFDEVYLDTWVQTLTQKGIHFATGLTNSEADAVECFWSLTFPIDLRQLLQYALPISKGFPDWRAVDTQSLRDAIEWPLAGMCFDIEHNTFWMDEWGSRPSSLEAAQAIAKQAVQNAPFLVPVYSHRYLPAQPCASGNPIFSVYQTDIIHYGHHLADYFHREFGVFNPDSGMYDTREIAFWSELGV